MCLGSCTTTYSTKTLIGCQDITNGCYSGKTRDEIDSLCLTNQYCHGYTFSSSSIENESGTGNGCLKKNCPTSGDVQTGDGTFGYRTCTREGMNLNLNES